MLITTARLGLRELVPSDLEFVAELLGDPEVMRYYPRTYDRVESQAWLERQRARYAADGHGLWLVVRSDDDAPVGTVGLAMQQVDGLREPEVGWLIHRPYWRQHYASEAARGVVDHAFHRHGYGHLISLIRPENLPSQGVARKLGMLPERRTVFHGYEHFVFTLRPITT